MEPNRPWMIAHFWILFCTLLFWWSFSSSIPFLPILRKHTHDCNSLPILEVIPNICPDFIRSLSWVEATLHFVEKQSTRATDHPCKVLVGALRWSHVGWMLTAYIIGQSFYPSCTSICSSMIFFLVLFMVCSFIHIVCRTFHGQMVSSYVKKQITSFCQTHDFHRSRKQQPVMLLKWNWLLRPKVNKNITKQNFFFWRKPWARSQVKRERCLQVMLPPLIGRHIGKALIKCPIRLGRKLHPHVGFYLYKQSARTSTWLSQTVPHRSINVTNPFAKLMPHTLATTIHDANATHTSQAHTTAICKQWEHVVQSYVWLKKNTRDILKPNSPLPPSPDTPSIFFNDLDEGTMQGLPTLQPTTTCPIKRVLVPNQLSKTVDQQSHEKINELGMDMKTCFHTILAPHTDLRHHTLHKFTVCRKPVAPDTTMHG